MVFLETVPVQFVASFPDQESGAYTNEAINWLVKQVVNFGNYPPASPPLFFGLAGVIHQTKDNLSCVRERRYVPSTLSSHCPPVGVPTLILHSRRLGLHQG